MDLCFIQAPEQPIIISKVCNYMLCSRSLQYGHRFSTTDTEKSKIKTLRRADIPKAITNANHFCKAAKLMLVQGLRYRRLQDFFSR